MGMHGWDRFELDGGRLSGMETAFGDGSMLAEAAVMRNDEDDAPWCWIVREYDDGDTPYAVTASYDDGTWYGSATEAFEGCVAFLRSIGLEVGEEEKEDARRGLLRRLFSAGLATLMSAFLVATPAYAYEADCLTEGAVQATMHYMYENGYEGSYEMTDYGAKLCLTDESGQDVTVFFNDGDIVSEDEAAGQLARDGYDGDWMIEPDGEGVELGVPGLLGVAGASVAGAVSLIAMSGTSGDRRVEDGRGRRRRGYRGC